MQIAQRLYQGIDIEGDTIGLITYMRTDGTNISKDADETFRYYIADKYGKDYASNVNFHAAHYGSKVPNIEGKDVLILDYSYDDIEKLEKFLESINKAE